MPIALEEKLSRKRVAEKGTPGPVSLSTAEYRSGLACSLYEAILEKASDECSPQLVDLISLACDINQEIHLSLKAATGMTQRNLQ